MALTDRKTVLLRQCIPCDSLLGAQGPNEGHDRVFAGSVTFGRPDLRTVYLGSLLGTRIPYFRSPAVGLPLLQENKN